MSFEVLSFLIHLFSSLSLFRSPFPLFPLLLPRSLTTTVSDDAPDAPSHPSLRRRSRRRRLVVVVVVERRRGAEVAGADTSDANAAPASSFLSPRPPVDVVSLRSESEERLCLFPCRRPGSFFARAADRGAREIEKERGGEKSPFSLFFLFAPTSPPPSPPQPAFFMKKMSVHATHIAIRSDSVRARAREKSRPLSFFLFAPTSPQNLLSSPLTLPSPTCLFIKKGERARDEMDERAGRARTRSVPTGCARKREGGGGTQRERGGGGREREDVRRAGAAACLMRLGGACAFFVRARIFPVFFRSRHPPHSSASTPTLPLTLSVSCRHVMVGRDGASDAVVDARQRQRTTTAATAVGAGAPRKSARLTSPRRMMGERRGGGR